MPTFTPGQVIATQESSIEVSIDPATPLPPGRHRFELVVVDDAGNLSDPAYAEIIVRDDERPTAVLDAPPSVTRGQSFRLSGNRSSDVAPGRVVEYRWRYMA